MALADAPPNASPPQTIQSVAPTIHTSKNLDSMGVNVHFFTLKEGKPLTTAEDLDRIRDVGFRWVRMDLLWCLVEKQAGVYDFANYDYVIEELLKRGIRPMITLGLGNPVYNAELSLRPARTKRGFENYVRATVKHYRGKGLVYELVNESNHPLYWKPEPNAIEYMTIFRDLFPQLKRLDPSAQYAAPSTAGAPLDYLETCFKQGMLKWVDGITIHPYQTYYETPPYKRSPEAFHEEFTRTRSLVQRYMPKGKHVPVLLGEWGYTSIPEEVDEDTQANYLVRQNLLGILYDSPVNIWYNWKLNINGTYKPGVKEDNFGLIDPSSSELKPAYLALQEMNRHLAGKPFIKRLPSDPQDFLLQFGNGQQSTLAMWTTNTPHSIDVNGATVLLSGKPAFTSSQ